jgi:hypothetical protein
VTSGRAKRSSLPTRSASSWVTTVLESFGIIATREGVFIAFNSVRIAKRGRNAEAWVSVEPGWKVTPVGRAELQVQHNENHGVHVSLAR